MPEDTQKHSVTVTIVSLGKSIQMPTEAVEGTYEDAERWVTEHYDTDTVVDVLIEPVSTGQQPSAGQMDQSQLALQAYTQFWSLPVEQQRDLLWQYTLYVETVVTEELGDPFPFLAWYLKGQPDA